MVSHTIQKHQPGERQLAIRVLAMPADANAFGDIFGGWLMSQVDIAGSTVACQVAQGRVVTVAVNDFQFIKPVYIGDLVSCYSEVKRIGHTSINVETEVFVEREQDPASMHRVAEATVTYVAIDKEGKPREVPQAQD